MRLGTSIGGRSSASDIPASFVDNILDGGRAE